MLEQPLNRIEGVVRARRPKRLPVVLSRHEMEAILAQLDGDPYLVCTLLYGSGLYGTSAPRLNADVMPKPDPVRPLEFDIPPAAVRDGMLDLAWTSALGHAGRGAQVAEAWLIRQ